MHCELFFVASLEGMKVSFSQNILLLRKIPSFVVVIKPPYTDSKQNLGFAGVKLQFPDDKAILVVTELLSSYRLGI